MRKVIIKLNENYLDNHRDLYSNYNVLRIIYIINDYLNVDINDELVDEIIEKIINENEA